MKKYLLSLLLFFCFTISAKSQWGWHQQYFDGEDTVAFQSVFVNTDTSGIWQIGPPQKIIFESASTIPNVLVTDTINTYPDSLSASAWFMVYPDMLYAGAIAIQWNQKIDFELNKDGGIVEFSSDSGATWQNAFYHPDVYNFYGWDIANEGALPSGEPCFTGTDSTWRNVWLCFIYDYLWDINNLSVRFRIVSDSVETNQEGWMIDNLIVAETWFHPVAEQSSYNHFKIFPTVTERTITIQQIDTNPDLTVKEVQLLDIRGELIRSIPVSSTSEVIDLSDLPAGRYFISVKFNDTKEIHEIIIAR